MSESTLNIQLFEDLVTIQIWTKQTRRILLESTQTGNLLQVRQTYERLLKHCHALGEKAVEAKLNEYSLTQVAATLRSIAEYSLKPLRREIEVWEEDGVSNYPWAIAHLLGYADAQTKAVQFSLLCVISA